MAVPRRDRRRSTGFTSTRPRMSAATAGSTPVTRGLRRTTDHQQPRGEPARYRRPRRQGRVEAGTNFSSLVRCARWSDHRQHHAHLIPKGLPGAGNLRSLRQRRASGYGPPSVWRRGTGVVRAAEFARPRDRSGEPETVWCTRAGAQFSSSNISGAQRRATATRLHRRRRRARVEVTNDRQIVWEWMNAPAAARAAPARVPRVSHSVRVAGQLPRRRRRRSRLGEWRVLACPKWGQGAHGGNGFTGEKGTRTYGVTAVKPRRSQRSRRKQRPFDGRRRRLPRCSGLSCKTVSSTTSDCSRSLRRLASHPIHQGCGMIRIPGGTVLRLLLLIVVGMVALPGSPTPASAQACDRACLRTMLDQYLTAVIKHDPSAAPLAVGFRQTENAINTRPARRLEDGHRPRKTQRR